jgi:cysteine desulfurase family protein
MIYFDNAATTFPKPLEVMQQITDVMSSYCGNPGRSGHKMSLQSGEAVFNCRQLMAETFGLDNPEQIVFTKNATEGLNIIIKGIISKGEHMIISSFEHNSVTRPAWEMRQQGVMVSVARVNPLDDNETVKNFKNAIRSNTRLICCLHVSNVFGNRLPIGRLARLAREKEIPFMVDASQSAGMIPINMAEEKIDFLCAPGHKGLYGPQGTGILAINCDTPVRPLLSGGTGSLSMDPQQPDFYPDRLESGTVNVPGVVGLMQGVEFIRRQGIENIAKWEEELCGYMVARLREMPHVTVYLPEIGKRSLFSFNVENMDCEKVAAFLDENDIAVRSGLHCSPMAHKSMMTHNTGTVRVSPGWFSTLKDAGTFIDCIWKLKKI